MHLRVAPELSEAPSETKQVAMRQLQTRFREMNIMVTEKCAITCRAAPSFLRVGHFELHSRRLARPAGPGEPSASEARAQLVALFEHAVRREFATEVDAAAPLGTQ